MTQYYVHHVAMVHTVPHVNYQYIQVAHHGSCIHWLSWQRWACSVSWYPPGRHMHWSVSLAIPVADRSVLPPSAGGGGCTPHSWLTAMEATATVGT